MKFFDLEMDDNILSADRPPIRYTELVNTPVGVFCQKSGTIKNPMPVPSQAPTR